MIAGSRQGAKHAKKNGERSAGL